MLKLSCSGLILLSLTSFFIARSTIAQTTVTSVEEDNVPSGMHKKLVPQNLPSITTEKSSSIQLNTLEVPYSDKSIKLDGDLNDLAWQQALPVELDIVNSPWDNLPSPIKTTAKLIENGEFLYIAFIAYDPKPSKIQGFLTDRDKAWSHDLVGIKLDTHNNRRLNYEFFVNPYGVQNDATFNEITGLANESWDGLWHSFGKKTEQGYQVEMAIPYNILNFKENNNIKKWAIELVRTYPREKTLRISHVAINRDNPCWLCQYPEAVGFKDAKIGKNLRLTPSTTYSNQATRDVYDSKDNWHNTENIDASLELRWGINTSNLLNATLNPDFSAIESDSGQLSVNTNFSLFYQEKRAFFLDNSDYFSSDFDLIYTRNIADPDYGVKFTGRTNKHSYGVFLTNDTETNILLPGNLQSNVATLAKESHSGALRYRFDYNDDLTLGTIATLRSADDYHNYVYGVDGRYRLSDSSAIKAQLISSDTLYNDNMEIVSFAASNTNNASFDDYAFKINFLHDSEYWLVKLDHQDIGADFRADLGFIPKVDIKTDTVQVKRNFYAEQASLWQEASLSGTWEIIHNTHNELIEKTLSTTFAIDGPMQSFLSLDFTHGEKVGLRTNAALLTISDNSSLFTEDQFSLYSSIYVNNRTYLSLDLTVGDKIDYSNNRLGELIESTANITIFITDHIEFDFYQTYSQLDAKNNKGINDNVYVENISELRVSYQFNVHSYLKLSLIYTDIDRNPDNNLVMSSEQNKYLSSQLIYAYKLNPQTVFFLGYSDQSLQDDYLKTLRMEERTFFTKISYAWNPN